MAKLEIAVCCLGAGYFSRFHYEAWQRLAQVALLGACDLDEQKAAQTGAAPFTDLDVMLKTCKPDILDIVTPPATHADAIFRALDAGVAVIVCQKPFCSNYQEAMAVVEKVAATSSTLVIHENFRFQPWFRAMAAAMQAGELGQVHQATFRLRTGDGQGADAYLDRQPYFQSMERLLVHETAIHYIDTFRYLLGDIRSVYADLRRMNPVIAGEDAGYILFEFDQGVRALFDGNRNLDHAATNTRLTLGEGLLEGSSGSLSLTGEGSLSLRKFGQQTSRELLKAQDWAGFGGDCVFACNQHIVSHLQNGSPLENTAGDYLVNLQIEQLVYQSSEEKRQLPVPGPAPAPV